MVERVPDLIAHIKQTTTARYARNPVIPHADCVSPAVRLILHRQTALHFVVSRTTSISPENSLS